MKAKVTYYIRNQRLDIKKTRTLTVTVSEEAYKNWDVDKMCKEANYQLIHREQRDSFLWIKKIRVGRTEFII